MGPPWGMDLMTYCTMSGISTTAIGFNEEHQLQVGLYALNYIVIIRGDGGGFSLTINHLLMVFWVIW